METLLALSIGVLFGCGTYLLLRRNLVKNILGLALLSNGTNLLIFTAAGLRRDGPPLIPMGADRLGESADPLPQALILTAIVITFGVTAFALVLLHRTHEETNTDDPDQIRSTELLDPPGGKT